MIELFNSSQAVLMEISDRIEYLQGKRFCVDLFGLLAHLKWSNHFSHHFQINFVNSKAKNVIAIFIFMTFFAISTFFLETREMNV